MSIRVIAGNLKRRVLKTPSGLATRPTAARVREALFSILGDLTSLTVLDLYAGSGALGIEALSRGAAHVTFVEHDRNASACIRENIELLKLDAMSTLLTLRVERAAVSLGSQGRRFDLVLCDPPWSLVGEAATSIPTFLKVLAPAARVVIEHPARHAPSIDGFIREDERAWGDTGISIFTREPDGSTDRSADGV
jgi:16S rRNA (guanine966-N2)-methyltransferase